MPQFDGCVPYNTNEKRPVYWTVDAGIGVATGLPNTLTYVSGAKVSLYAADGVTVVGGFDTITPDFGPSTTPAQVLTVAHWFDLLTPISGSALPAGNYVAKVKFTALAKDSNGLALPRSSNYERSVILRVV